LIDANNQVKNQHYWA